jgi:photoprotection regulator FRP-like protein
MMRDLSWSPAEKKAARAAFERARAREAAALVELVRAKARAVAGLDDVWALAELIEERRSEMQEHYDYRYSVLPIVFANLIRDGWLSLDELAGLGDDKREFIERIIAFAGERP